MIWIFSLILQNLISSAQISADFGGGSGGAIRIGESVTACSSLVQGAVKFDASDRTLKYCDATNWKLLIADACATSLPTDWSFTDLTAQTRSTLVTSSIHQITGIGSCVAAVSVSGVGSTAEYRICSDSSCTSVDQTWGTAAGTITNNKYIQLRLTTSAFGNLAHTASVTVGHRLETWSVTTSGNCSDTTPALGTYCADGTFYVGQSPDGNVKMYTTPCDVGRFWNGITCSGSSISIPWSNGGSVYNSAADWNSGESNTNLLAGLSNADDPYIAPDYCYQFNGNGQTDWYLPAVGEIVILRAACGAMPDANCADGSRRWTSFEVATTSAEYFTYSGGWGTTSKWNLNAIRCVRKD
jgi:hypothetical protein